MSRYKELKEKQRNARADKRLALTDDEELYLLRVEAIIGYEVVLLLPHGGKFILGSDDAEAILARLLPQLAK